jgi:PAS domain S-box-containing protein
MAQEEQINTFRGILPFLILFFSILVLFVLLSNFVPLVQEVGWVWIVLFLFLFFVGEPLYRRRTDRYEYHILLLEIYIFGAYFIQLFFPGAPYSHLFYVIPIFSAALSFGLIGTMCTAFAAFFLEILRVAPIWEMQAHHFQQVLPDILPLVILALLLGFTVEVKNYTQQQLLNRLARMDAFRGLKNIVEVGRQRLPFTEDLLKSVIELTEASGGVVKNLQRDELVVARGFKNIGLDDFQKSVSEGSSFYRGNKIYRIELPWEDGDYLLALQGGNLHGILLEAEEEMVRALATYLHHFVDYLRIQHEKENSARLRETLIETVPLGIIVTDQGGNIEEINRAAAQLLSCNQDEAVNLTVTDILKSRRKEIELKNIRREIEIAVGEEIIPADISIRRAKLGGAVKWLVVISDLRPLKKLQQKAERRRQMLALGEMAAGLAHEIRNPLGSLSGFVSLLDEKIEQGGKKELKRLSQKIRRSYRRIDRLIDQFIKYARQPESSEGEFGLHIFCSKIADTVEFSDELEFDYKCSLPDEDIVIEGDSRRLEMALRNIILNAAEANGVSNVKMRLAENESGEVVLSITDDGAGIESKMKDKVFDPFVTTKEGGMGLGLALAQRVINEEFSGRIEIESTPKEGTTVSVIL